jgi:hypothetical protein
VSVIGWIWFALGMMMVLSGAMGFLVYSFQAISRPMPAPPAELGPVFSFMFEHFGTLALCQIAFALFIAFSALMFLRQRWWAWRTLQAVTWLAILYVVLFGVSWVAVWVQLPDTGPAPAPGIRIVGAMMGTAGILMFLVPLVVLLRFLNSNSVRNACTR